MFLPQSPAGLPLTTKKTVDLGQLGSLLLHKPKTRSIDWRFKCRITVTSRNIRRSIGSNNLIVRSLHLQTNVKPQGPHFFRVSESCCNAELVIAYHWLYLKSHISIASSTIRDVPQYFEVPCYIDADWCYARHCRCR